MRAVRALAGMEKKTLAKASGVSLPTIQRMEVSNGVVRGVIESLTKVMAALEAAGIELINEGAASKHRWWPAVSSQGRFRSSAQILVFGSSDWALFGPKSADGRIGARARVAIVRDEGPEWAEPCRSIAVPRMAGIGVRREKAA